MKKLTLNSYAKVNLFLNVKSKRPDNYHNLQTVFERISLSDKIVLKNRPDGKIRIFCAAAGVPKDRSNLCYKAAAILRAEFAVKQGVDITITKRIPVGGGLAGGSSNAACVLQGLNRLWDLKLGQKELAGFGRKIGADVAFFLHNTAFAFATGRGDRIEELKKLSKRKFWHVLVASDFKVSTPLIYRQWDKALSTKKIPKPALTTPARNVKILTSALAENDLSLISQALYNSLEPVSSMLYPRINRVKQELIRAGAKAVLMSGSGPTVFGLAATKKEALDLSRQLRRGKGRKIFIAATK